MGSEGTAAAARSAEDDLRQLSVRYASAIDRRHSDDLVRLFTADVVFTVVPSADSTRPETESVGLDAIRGLPAQVEQFRRTFHFLGQSRYDISGRVARGEVYCIAHHLLESTNYVMYIRYDDQYAEIDGDGWRISRRRVLIDWTERRGLR